jgi:hypothetical protein
MPGHIGIQVSKDGDNMVVIDSTPGESREASINGIEESCTEGRCCR